MREGTGVADAVEHTEGTEWFAARGKSRAREEGRSVRAELSSVDEVEEDARNGVRLASPCSAGGTALCCCCWLSGADDATSMTSKSSTWRAAGWELSGV